MFPPTQGYVGKATIKVGLPRRTPPCSAQTTLEDDERIDRACLILVALGLPEDYQGLIPKD